MPKERSLAANQEKTCYKEINKTAKALQNSSTQYSCRRSYRFIKARSNCSAPDLKPALQLQSFLVNSWNNQSKDNCSQLRPPPIPYLFRCWGRCHHYNLLQSSCASALALCSLDIGRNRSCHFINTCENYEQMQ